MHRIYLTLLLSSLRESISDRRTRARARISAGEKSFRGRNILAPRPAPVPTARNNIVPRTRARIINPSGTPWTSRLKEVARVSRPRRGRAESGSRNHIRARARVRIYVYAKHAGEGRRAKPVGTVYIHRGRVLYLAVVRRRATAGPQLLLKLRGKDIGRRGFIASLSADKLLIPAARTGVIWLGKVFRVRVCIYRGTYHSE